MGGVIVVFICVIGAIVWGVMAGKKRRDAMTLLTARLGFHFQHERDYNLADRYPFLDKLRQGSNQYAYNVLNGTYQDHSISAFDFHYETYAPDKDGKQETHHHHFSFFVLTLPKSFPDLTLAKESFFSMIAPTGGYDDIDFESHEFSKKFVVRSKDKKFAHAFCNARMIEYLMDHPNISIEVNQNMLAIGFNHCLTAEQIIPHLNRLSEISELMPDYVFEPGLSHEQ